MDISLIVIGKVYQKKKKKAFRFSNQNEQCVHSNPSKWSKQKYPWMIPLGTKLFKKNIFTNIDFFFFHVYPLHAQEYDVKFLLE